MRRDAPEGLPTRWGKCQVCTLPDVGAADVAFALGASRVPGASYASCRTHRAKHMWAWILDESVNAGAARAKLAEIAAWLAASTSGVAVPRTVAALQALAVIDAYLYPQHVALEEQRRRDIAARDLDVARLWLRSGEWGGAPGPEAAGAAVARALDAVAAAFASGIRGGGVR
jgi:hypothetical protein